MVEMKVYNEEQEKKEVEGTKEKKKKRMEEDLWIGCNE